MLDSLTNIMLALEFMGQSKFCALDFKHKQFLIPREQNNIADTLATTASSLKILVHRKRKYEIVVKHRPSILDNVKHQQVFEDEQWINFFLEMTYDFAVTIVDGENQHDSKDEQKNGVNDQDLDPKEFLNTIGEGKLFNSRIIVFLKD